MNYENTHRELVEACKNHDRQAQFELYGLYSKAMYNICIRMLNDVEEAQDVLQNSFIDVFTKLNYFQYKSSIGAWIRRVVVNNCINRLKKRRLELVPLETYHHPEIEEEETDTSYFDLSIEQVKQAVQQLPDGYRAVLTLYLFEGYDHIEIGEIMGISVSTSKSQYNRGKKRLRELIMSE